MGLKPALITGISSSKEAGEKRMSFYSPTELASIGFRSCGEHVLISRKASIYNAGAIDIGSHVRVDDFCVLSAGAGGIHIGNFVHVSVFASMIGDGRISLGDYSGLSGRVAVYSSNDDYSGEHLTNPMVPSTYRGVRSADVTLGRHALVGAGAIVLPGVTIGEGVAIGAQSLVRSDCLPFYIYAGVPARRIKQRSRRLLEIEEMHKADQCRTEAL